MGDDSCIANDVDCYNVAKVVFGANSTVTQYSYLCAGSHDITKSDMPVITAPIIIEDQAWVTASVFIGMGVTIGQGAVVAACAVVIKDVPPWTVVAGNPAKVIKERKLES
jgi:putative colanic acid biosynthesis acetyltransferase WcaF